MKNMNENGRSMIEMLEKVKQPLNVVLRRQAQVFRCCQSALAPRRNTENQVTEAPLGARRRQCALAQSGRSMIEMLGVLAIIGVLSVGGIMGYSKAMHRYRVNKTIEIMSKVFHNFDVITSTKIVGDGDAFYEPEEMIKLGFIDKEDCPIGEGQWGDSVCELPIGQLDWDFYFFSNSENQYGNPNKFYGEFWLDFTGANKVEQCIDFVSHDWLSIIPRKWWIPEGYISIYTGDDDTYIYDYSGEASDLPADTKPTLEQIVDACGKCEGKDWCLWYVVFVHEL